MIFQKLQNLVEENRNLYTGYLRNILKNYLQLLVLNFVYNSKYSFLIFKGGSCLRICFDLPRLSEDLDFDYEKKFDLSKFFKEITNYVKKEQNFLQLEAKISKERIYLKFPVLKKLKLAGPAESDKLYVKIELTPSKKCKYKTELQPIFEEGFSFMVRRYSLEDLMAGKIGAVLERTWFKGKKDEIAIKGRDYFDLYWYLEKEIIPNYDCIIYKGKKLKRKVWGLLKERVEKIKSKDLEYDLINLIKDQEFVKNFCKNYKLLFENQLKKYIVKT